jgi:hypothetical protein
MSHTPSQRLKRLYDSRPSDDDRSLKDFACDLARNGTKDEKQLVEEWFKNKT